MQTRDIAGGLAGAGVLAGSFGWQMVAIVALPTFAGFAALTWVLKDSSRTARAQRLILAWRGESERKTAPRGKRQ